MRGDSPEFSSSTEDSLQRLKNYDWSCSLTNRFLIKCNYLFNAVLTEIQECVKNELHSMIQPPLPTTLCDFINVSHYCGGILAHFFIALLQFIHLCTAFCEKKWNKKMPKTSPRHHRAWQLEWGKISKCPERFPLINNLPHFKSMASNCLEIALLPFADWQLAAILL